MSHAEQHLKVYRDQIIALRRSDADAAEDGVDAIAAAIAAFGVGFLFGAGLPQAAATFAHCYRRAYGRALPILFEGEE